MTMIEVPAGCLFFARDGEVMLVSHHEGHWTINRFLLSVDCGWASTNDYVPGYAPEIKVGGGHTPEMRDYCCFTVKADPAENRGHDSRGCRQAPTMTVEGGGWLFKVCPDHVPDAERRIKHGPNQAERMLAGWR